MLVAGVDGCRRGWLCLLLDTANGQLETRYHAEFAELLRQKPMPKAIAIDIPIGVWEKGDRPCDKKARALLRWPRRCSVFPPPPASALKAESYNAANRLSRKASGKGLTRQSYGILKKIREVDECFRREPRLRSRVHEVHPEISFWALNGREALKNSKKSREGKEERLRLLRPLFANLDGLLAVIDRHNAAVDDLLDAAAAVWTARRIAAGEECRLRSQERDCKGLRMEITY